jgi:hypothetical protein
MDARWLQTNKNSYGRLSLFRRRLDQLVPRFRLMCWICEQSLSLIQLTHSLSVPSYRNVDPCLRSQNFITGPHSQHCMLQSIRENATFGSMIKRCCQHLTTFPQHVILCTWQQGLNEPIHIGLGYVKWMFVLLMICAKLKHSLRAMRKVWHIYTSKCLSI